MPWHVYEIVPIDFNWDQLRTVDETARSLRARAVPSEDDAEDPTATDFLEAWESAKQAAAAAGWEGDFRNEPGVLWLPAEGTLEFGFVLKQDNNGTTYVVSPVPMPHLEELA